MSSEHTTSSPDFEEVEVTTCRGRRIAAFKGRLIAGSPTAGRRVYVGPRGGIALHDVDSDFLATYIESEDAADNFADFARQWGEPIPQVVSEAAHSLGIRWVEWIDL